MHRFLDDLEQRLATARAEQAEIAEYIESLESLIAIERKRERRAGSAMSIPPSQTHRSSALRHGVPKKRRVRRPPGQPNPAREFLLEFMSGGQPWPLDSLKRAAEERQVDFEGKSAGPVLHFTLVALKRSGQADYDSETKVWRLKMPTNSQAA